MINQVFKYKRSELCAGPGSADYWENIRNMWKISQTSLAKIGSVETAGFRNLITSLIRTDQNNVISPASLYCGLLFLADLCSENARNEILNVLFCSHTNPHIISETIKTGITEETSDARCHMSASVWANAHVPLHIDSIQTICQAHQADAFTGVMGSEEINAAIQTWINESTESMLSSDSSSMQTDYDTIFEFFATSCLKAVWSDPFWPANTDTGLFHVNEKTDVQCAYMNSREKTLCFCGNQFTAVSKDLRSDSQMWFILPKAGVLLKQLIENASVKRLLSNPSGMLLSEYEVSMSIPKFDISSNLDIKPALQSMGIRSVFDIQAADSSPVAKDIPLLLRKADHVSRIQISEEGVEAASYTDFSIAASALPLKTKKLSFKLDRPFLFAITKGNKVPLYVGAVVNPTQMR